LILSGTPFQYLYPENQSKNCFLLVKFISGSKYFVKFLNPENGIQRVLCTLCFVQYQLTSRVEKSVNLVKGKFFGGGMGWITIFKKTKVENMRGLI